MKKQLRYSLLAILALMITIGLAFAQPVPISTTKQWSPVELSPTAWSRTSTAVTVSGAPSMYDGDLTLVGYARPAAATAPSPLWFQLYGFTTPYPEPFPIGFVDLKMKYDIVGGVDDMYRIEYQVGSSAWVPLVPDTTEGFATGIRPWAQITEPVDGTWDWADIGSINLRVTWTKVGSYSTTQLTMYIYEAWLTVYPEPLPPAASTTVSVQPPGVGGVAWNPGITWADNIFFVDVYVQDVLELAGYEFTMQYDTALLMFLDAFGYWPWVDFLVTDDPVAGQTNVIGTADPPISDVGFDGNSPMARLYFAVNWGAGGTCSLDLIVSKLGTPIPEPITHTVYNGFYSHPYYLSFPSGIFPAYTDPTGSVWHEDYPTYSNTWTVTGWTDNGDGTLSPSDQLAIEVDGLVKEYHVDQVTITIHWTFKDTYVGEAGADPEDPTTVPDPPEFDPLYTRWHQIYPEYCRAFTIESWEDNGDGYFSPSDQFDFTYDDTMENVNAHLDAITTNIWVSEKPPPEEAEFPLGIGLAISLAALIPVIYIWRTRPKKKVA